MEFLDDSTEEPDANILNQYTVSQEDAIKEALSSRSFKEKRWGTVNFENPIGKGAFGVVYPLLPLPNDTYKRVIKVIKAPTRELVQKELFMDITATPNMKHPMIKNNVNALMKKYLSPQYEDAQRAFVDLVAVEVKILKALSDEPSSRDNPSYVVRMHGSLYIPRVCVVICMDQYDGTLWQHIQSNTGMKNDDEYKRVCSQLIKGVKFLHDHRVVHRDLKSDNVLVKYVNGGFWSGLRIDVIALSDFGQSKYIFEEDTYLETCPEYEICTVTYRAPELFGPNIGEANQPPPPPPDAPAKDRRGTRPLDTQRDPTLLGETTRSVKEARVLLAKPPRGNKYTNVVDIWSLGCIFGEMVLGDTLFHYFGSSQQQYSFCKIPCGEAEPVTKRDKELKERTLNVCTFLENRIHKNAATVWRDHMLAFNPARRYSVDALEEAWKNMGLLT